MPAAPTAPARATPPAARHPTWPWAVGSILTVVVVFAVTLAGRHIVAQLRQSALVAPAPPQPALPVMAVTSPQAPIMLAGLDAAAGHLVALTATSEPSCPPVGACPAARPLAAFVVLDGATGAELAHTQLASEAAPASTSVLLLTDAAHHVAYAVAPHAVTLFSTLTGERTGGYALPNDVPWQRETGGALAASHNMLLLSGGGQLVALDAATGRPRAARTLGDSGARDEGPVLDGVHDRLYVLQCTEARCVLAAYAPDTLLPLGQWPLPAGTRLGPLDMTSGTLYLYAADGAVSALSLDTLASGAGTAMPMPVDALRGARALAADAAHGVFVVATSDAVELREAVHGSVRAALPVRVAWPGSAALLLDDARGLLYLPTAGGEVMIARSTADSQPQRAATAVALARASLVRFLPDTNQDPPFLTPETFPLGEGTRPTTYWIHFSDLGWKGPYAGSAMTHAVPRGGQPGAYTVTFTITWHQLFERSHNWVCAVAPDGSVRLLSERGDAVP